MTVVVTIETSLILFVGKCIICYFVLSALRKKFKDDHRRSIARELQGYHRSLYMAERNTYYMRRELGIRYV